MASTTAPSRASGAAGPPRAAPTLSPRGRRQRRWSLALVALLVTVGSALAFAVLWMNAGGREPVLAVANNVQAGQIIDDDDLTVVRVATDAGITPLASSARDDVIGQPAATDLLAGSLLIPDAVGSDAGLDSGTSVVSVPVPTEELPADLEAGNNVALYVAGASGSADGPASALPIGTGQVFAVGDGEESNVVSVSVTIDEAAVPDIVGAIQADQIYLTLSAAEPSEGEAGAGGEGGDAGTGEDGAEPEGG